MEFPKDVLVAHLFQKRKKQHQYCVIEGTKVKLSSPEQNGQRAMNDDFWKKTDSLLLDVFGPQKELMQSIIKAQDIEDATIGIWKESLVLQYPELFASIVGGERSPYELKGIFYVNILNQVALYREREAVQLTDGLHNYIELRLDKLKETTP